MEVAFDMKTVVHPKNATTKTPINDKEFFHTLPYVLIFPNTVTLFVETKLHLHW